MNRLTVVRPDPRTLDVYGTDRYEIAPAWGPGMMSGPHRAGACYLTGSSSGIVVAMGCQIGWTDLAGRNRMWSSATLAPWAAGPLSATGLGQATPWHISISHGFVGFYSRQRAGDRLVQHVSRRITSPMSEGELRPTAIAASGRRVVVAVGQQIFVDERNAYRTAQRGRYPCWETYIGSTRRDPRPWLGDLWTITSATDTYRPVAMRRLLGTVPGTAADALALTIDALN
ncbi:hypothetical protein [uncultured Propionibacterium sp.]|uniref:hypothetical protein n=1 Tax=uncultured Propionibacterium sp. TaxID=218066 RepID=UPI00292D9C60|nr:hypothetical protein [uncultured Propionibacterium sp.]